MNPLAPLKNIFDIAHDLDQETERAGQLLSAEQKKIAALKEAKVKADAPELVAAQALAKTLDAEMTKASKARLDYEKNITAAYNKVEETTRDLDLEAKAKFVAGAPVKYREAIILRFDPKPDRVDLLNLLTAELLEYGEVGHILGGPEMKDKTFSRRGWPTDTGRGSAPGKCPSTSFGG